VSRDRLPASLSTRFIAAGWLPLSCAGASRDWPSRTGAAPDVMFILFFKNIHLKNVDQHFL
jgi:hypothetical protein